MRASTYREMVTFPLLSLTFSAVLVATEVNFNRWAEQACVCSWRTRTRMPAAAAMAVLARPARTVNGGTVAARRRRGSGLRRRREDITRTAQAIPGSEDEVRGNVQSMRKSFRLGGQGLFTYFALFRARPASSTAAWE